MPFVRRFIQDCSGNMAVIFGLMLVPVAGLAGAALDYSRASGSRVELQSAADAAALGAVLARSSSDEKRIETAKQVFRANFGSGDGAQVSAAVQGRTALVTATASVPTAILPLLGIDSIGLRVQSAATKLFEGPPVCVLALNESAAGAVTFTGSAEFLADRCAVHSNSNSSSGLVIDGSASVQAAAFCSVGGTKAPPGVRPEPRSYCHPVEDPFAALEPPPVGACLETSLQVKPNQMQTLKPGVYCKGLDLKGRVTLKPGVYVIKDGPLTISSQADVSGEGVTFYLTGANAGFTINGGGELDLKAPVDGDYGGILIFQDRQSSPGATNTINGGSDSIVQGIIYTPEQQLTVNGGSGFMQTVPLMSIIADQVKFAGSAAARADITGVDLPFPLPNLFSGARLTH